MSTENTQSRAASSPGRAADRLVQFFMDEITSGRLRPGQALPPEREITEAHQVSRTVVREAVLALANKGLIDARPRHRPVVRAPTYDTAFDTVGSLVHRLLQQPRGVRNLFETRIMIEAALARQAALEAKRPHLQALRDALDANEAAVDSSEAFYRTDIAFHAVLYEVPANPVLPALHHAYTDWLAPRWSQMPRSTERNLRNVAAHCAIYEGILMRDPDAAETAVRDHLAQAWEQVSKVFSDI